MNKSRRDTYGVPSILAVDEQGNTVALKATEDGALLTTNSSSSVESRKLKEVIKLDLGTSRDKELVNVSFSEITIPVVEGKLMLYLGTPTDNRALTIDKPLSINTIEEKLYISNGSGAGNAEIWLWE